MSQRAMPFLFLNLSGEMAYILQQRLIAQRVTQQRSRQVLSEIMRVIFNEKFLSKLFDPQEQYSRSSLRQFFEKMAHSSVLRLNELSMDRLFDMMTMAVKQQMMLLDEPCYLLNMTVNHLNGIRRIIHYAPEVVSCVNSAHELLLTAFQNTRTWEMSIIRNALLNHFQDLHIRVSQMMRIGLQMDDGRFFLLGNQISMPFGTASPGSVRYFEKGQLNRIATFVLRETYSVEMYPYSIFSMDNSQRCTTLGDNIFRGEGPEPGAAGDEMLRSATNVNEMKLLSKLINRPELSVDGDNFDLSLFERESDGEQPKVGRSGSAKGKKSTKSKAAVSGPADLPTSGKLNVQKPKSLADKMNEMDIKSSKPPSTGPRNRGEQMLEMMDEPGPSTSGLRPSRSRSGSKKNLRARTSSATRKS